MTDKDFDKKIGEKLRDYTEQPPANLLARIEKTLGKAEPAPIVSKGKKGLMTYAYRYTAAAAAVAIVVFAAVKFSGGIMQKDRYAANDVAAWVQSAGATEINAGDVLNGEESLNGDAGTVNIIESIRKAVEEYGTERNGAVLPKKQISLLPDTDGGLVAEIIKNHDYDDNAGKDGGYALKASEDPDAQRRRRQRNEEIEKYWIDLFSAIARDERDNRKNILSSSLYAGNFGSGKDITRTNPMDAGSMSMIIAKGSSSIPDSPVMQGPSRGKQSVWGDESNGDVLLRHKMPFSIGFNLTYPVSDRVSVMSGLNYSYLYSNSTQPVGYEQTGGVTQELHYLGLPLSFKYSLYCNRTFDLYTRAGGMIEYSIYGVRKYDIGTGNPDVKRMALRHFQMSLDVAAGINFHMTPRLGLYIEPGVAYYFRGRNRPTSYYTETPANFILRVGFRFDL